MRHEGVLYHPECFKDLDKVSQVDSSMDTTADNLDTTAQEEKVKEQAENTGEGEHVGNILEMVKEEDVEMEANVKVEASELDKGQQAPVEKMETDPHGTTEEDAKPTDDNANNLEVKEEPSDEASSAVEEAKADEELGSANNSLVADGAESGMNSLSAPVVAQQKVVIPGQLLVLPVLKVQFYCSHKVTQQIYCGTCVLRVVCSCKPNMWAEKIN